MSDQSAITAARTPSRTRLRERPEPGPATVLIEANDRLQQVRSLLITAVAPDADTRQQR